MAAPTAPTAATIAAEGIKKGGYIATLSNQYTTVLARAQSEWLEEAKNDIWMQCKKLTSLQTDGIVMCVKGQAKYSMPTDYSSLIGDTIELIYGDTVTGTAQAGGTVSTVVMAAGSSATNNAYQGKEIVITGGTGANQVSQIYSYVGSTKVASIAPAMATATGATSTYMLIDNYYTMDEGVIWDYAKDGVTKDLLSRPAYFYPVGDDDNGQFYLYPTPDTTYAMRIRYYADLMELDLTSTTLATLYKNWRNVFVQKVFAECLRSKDDDRYQNELKIYGNMLRNLLAREEYGMDLSNMRIRVEE